MKNKIRLELIGITYNQIESGVYAVILQQENSSRRIPIIIGYPEAQSIECKLQEVVTPRPLTHDMMANMMSAFGISLREVIIRKLENGVFAADLILSDGIREITIDSRSSDAIAIAIRVGAPIYTTEDVLREAGFEPSSVRPATTPKRTRVIDSTQKRSSAFTDTSSLKTVEQLEQEMQQAADEEDYEKAARLKEEIERRKNNTK